VPAFWADENSDLHSPNLPPKSSAPPDQQG
jgi:hypothetical protein